MTYWKTLVSRENVMPLITFRKLVKDSLCIFEPGHEKTCLRGFRPGKSQTGLLS